MATLLLDNFNGSGPLRDHTSDSGAGWTAASWQADALLLGGTGLLQFELDDQSASFRSQAVVEQVDLRLEVVVDVGPITASALVTQHRSDNVQFDLWDWYDYGIELSNGAGANDIGGLPTLYITHRNNTHSLNVSQGSVLTVRWDIVVATNTVSIYVDDVLVRVSTDALRKDTPDKWFGGYFDRVKYSGLSSQPPMLRVSSIHIADTAPPPEPLVVPFWESFKKSYEVL